MIAQGCKERDPQRPIGTFELFPTSIGGVADPGRIEVVAEGDREIEGGPPVKPLHRHRQGSLSFAAVPEVSKGEDPNLPPRSRLDREYRGRRAQEVGQVRRKSKTWCRSTSRASRSVLAATRPPPR